MEILIIVQGKTSMCAISGIVNTHGRSYLDIISAMMQHQAHRGPDDHGMFECDDAVFAHNRLAVIDIESGHQPMISENERIVVVLNGEIYNYTDAVFRPFP